VQTQDQIGAALLERILTEAPQVADDIVGAARLNDGAEELRKLLGSLKVAGDRIPEVGDPEHLRAISKAMATMSMSLSFHVQTIRVPDVQRALATVVKIVGQYSELARQCADQFEPLETSLEDVPDGSEQPEAAAAEDVSPAEPAKKLLDIDEIASIPPPPTSESSPARQQVAPQEEPKPPPPTGVFDAQKPGSQPAGGSLQARITKPSANDLKPRAPTGIFQAYRPPNAPLPKQQPPPPEPPPEPEEEVDTWSIGVPSETGFFGGLSLKLRDKMRRDYPEFSGTDDLVDFAAAAGRGEIQRVVKLKTEPMEKHVAEQDLLVERLVRALGNLHVGAVILNDEQKVGLTIKGELAPMFVKGRPIPKALADGLQSVTSESVVDFEGIRIFEVDKDDSDNIVAFLFMPYDEDDDDEPDAGGDAD
jgi:hypothetical protein